MSQSKDYPNSGQQRTRIASAAARLIAEGGISDYAQAKRKAAHSLGLPPNTRLPEDSEVENELRTHQRLFQCEEQTAKISYLRGKAIEIMEIVQKFTPYLTGSVLDGTAGRYAEIDIQLFPDSAKDVEIFLLNRHIDYEHSSPRSERAEAVLSIHSKDVTVNLVIYPRHDERISFKKRDGTIRQRARLDTLKKLQAETARDEP